MTYELGFRIPKETLEPAIEPYHTSLQPERTYYRFKTDSAVYRTILDLFARSLDAAVFEAGAHDMKVIVGGDENADT